MSKPSLPSVLKKHYAPGRQSFVLKSGSQRGRRSNDNDNQIIIYGIHAVEAVLANKARHVHAVYLTRNAQYKLSKTIANTNFDVVQIEPKYLDRYLGHNTVHQGAMVKCEALLEPKLNDLITAAHAQNGPIVVLDQITDPHNFGAILRSCAAFGCSGVMATRRHSPPLKGALAKSASGALECIPVLLVQNLARGLETIANEGLEIIGLDSTGSQEFETAFSHRPIAIVLGAEGRGLRKTTQRVCTFVASIHTRGSIASLNVSNAASIALYSHSLMRKNSSL
ncbi:MAG: 23S rRNA (guanosine-2'-O-)-methyltransferase RlmB [Hyphomicrobiaceae bacterium hypho_1]